MTGNAILLATILEDHARIRQLLGDVTTTRDAKKRRDHYMDLRREITRHSLLEEQNLYPQLSHKEQTRWWARNALVQHGTSDRLLTVLDSLQCGGPAWEQAFLQLGAHLIEHMGSEEAFLIKALGPIAPAPKAPSARKSAWRGKAARRGRAA